MPSASVVAVNDQFPVPPVLVVPRDVVPWKSSTVELASAVPEKDGVLSLVMLSVLDEPVSLLAIKSGVDGAAGAPVSMVTLKLADAALVLPEDRSPSR